MKKTMSSKERVKTSFAHQEPDRVPINYHFFNTEIDLRLKKHFGLAADDAEGLRQAIGIDFRRVEAPYVGPQLHEAPLDRHVSVYGVHSRWIEHEAGGYWDICDFPLKDATLKEVEVWPLPSPDDYDYSQVPEQCKRNKQYYLLAGNRAIGDCINDAGFLRTMEQVLMDLISEEPALFCLMDRKLELELEVMRRTLEAGDGMIDMLVMGEDLGTQRGPLISLELCRKHIRPRHQKFVDLAKSFDIPVMIHSDGAVSWVYDDFIEMGIDVHDAVQIECEGMDPARLKQGWGDRLSFHGMIPTGGAVGFGSADDVIKQVREVLEIMMPGGGYVLAPSHDLQSSTPNENALALFEAALKYGRYS